MLEAPGNGFNKKWLYQDCSNPFLSLGELHRLPVRAAQPCQRSAYGGTCLVYELILLEYLCQTEVNLIIGKAKIMVN